MCHKIDVFTITGLRARSSRDHNTLHKNNDGIHHNSYFCFTDFANTTSFSFTKVYSGGRKEKQKFFFVLFAGHNFF